MGLLGKLFGKLVGKQFGKQVAKQQKMVRDVEGNKAYKNEVYLLLKGKTLT